MFKRSSTPTDPEADRIVMASIKGLGVHALWPHKAISFSEFKANHQTYADQFSDFVMPTDDELAADLAILVKLGLVEVIPE